jgi:uncharacterized protein
MSMMRWLLILSIAVGLSQAVPARAEDDAQAGTGFLELYPPGDVYQVQVIGDAVSEGLLSGLTEAFRADQRVQLKLKPVEFSGLMRAEFNEQLKTLEDTMVREAATVAVVMFGPQRRLPLKGPSGKKLKLDSEEYNDEWRAEFGRQVDAIMKALKRRKIAVYWVSQPNVRDSNINDDVQSMNEIIREKSYLNGMKYIDAYTGFLDDGGGYSAMGPDLSGKMRLLREQSGLSFTELGNRKLAHFVERELKRDLTQAKADRTIPLAGTDAEQATIRAAQTAAQKVVRNVAAAAPGVASAGAAAVVAEPAGPGVGANGEQKADSGRINLALVGAGGREEIVPVDLLRPAIPATVLALVNRKENVEKATQLGDLLVDQIAGGLMVMSSITPATDPASADTRRRLSPTQTPYFRVMVKGERVTPRPERADDISWPRPEPPVVVEPSVKPAAAVERKPSVPPRAKKLDSEGAVKAR